MVIESSEGDKRQNPGLDIRIRLIFVTPLRLNISTTVRRKLYLYFPATFLLLSPKNET